MDSSTDPDSASVPAESKEGKVTDEAKDADAAKGTGRAKNTAADAASVLTAADLDEIRKAFSFDAPLMLEADDALVNVTVPPAYMKIPAFGNVPSSLTRLGVDEIGQYFDELLENRISRINGLVTNVGDMMDCYVCDYCRQSLISGDESKYRYCQDCKVDMCAACFKEKTEAVAVSKNKEMNAKRATQLQSCLKSHRLQARDGHFGREAGLTSMYCDVCGKLTHDHTHEDEAQDLDVCDTCAATPKGRDFIQLHKVAKRTRARGPVFDWWGFGSLLDWVPLLRDEDGNLLLLNCNPASPRARAVGFCAVDDHGRCGYDYCTAPLPAVLALLRTAEAEHKMVSLEGWDDFYDAPLKRVMQHFHMDTHFG
jgi:hypothetical protein